MHREHLQDLVVSKNNKYCTCSIQDPDHEFGFGACQEPLKLQVSFGAENQFTLRVEGELVLTTSSPLNMRVNWWSPPVHTYKL